MATEKRLIDANKVAQDVRENNKYNFFQADWSSKRVCELLESAPAVDAVEVVHGRWNRNSSTLDIECSNCGKTLECWFDDDAKYCPNCGAKMDGDENA